MKPQQAMNVAGVMSGTSADGIDVAIVRIFPQNKTPRLKLIAHQAFPFSKAMRSQILGAMDSKCAVVADIARLGTRLGIAYAGAIAETMRSHDVKVALAGCHGQTIYHQGDAMTFLGRRLAATWQLLDPSPIAEKLRIPVVSDFRPADMAAGGMGAPLVPLLDYEYFGSKQRHRVLLNLGGIGNMTLLPAGVPSRDVVAFDTGPANMVIDALMDRLFGKAFDRGGATAASGKACLPAVEAALRQPFFRRLPPKTTGREQFGSEFTQKFLHACRSHSATSEDAIASATLLTAKSIRIALQRFVRPAFGSGEIDLVISGGGLRNATMVKMIREEALGLDCKVLSSDDLGMPSQAKEAAAFALLAWNTWHGLAGNLPSATGAQRPVVLGRISHG
jgi:anhydro-N-acetylmuramic acid kinase